MGFPENAVIIEFNGIPGVGKSTVSRELARLAEEHQLAFYDSYYRSQGRKRVISLLLTPSYLSLLPSIIRFSRSFKYGYKKYRHIFGILMICRQYKDFVADGKNGILSLDQGIVQEFISIAHASRICPDDTVPRVLSKLERFGISFSLVDCDAPEEVVLERLRCRTGGGSRVEQNDNKEVLRILSVQNDNLGYIRKKFGEETRYTHVTVDTSLSPRENAVRIWNSLYETSIARQD
jgi:hypothetical protein